MCVDAKECRLQGTLAAAGFFSAEAAGFAVSFFASFTVPEGPGRMLVFSVFSIVIGNSNHANNKITLHSCRRG